MRWFWIDRFTEFEHSHRAMAVKNVALAEEHVDRYMPGFPIMPATLVIEGMAQTAGILIGEHNLFQQRVVLAKVSRAVFFGLAFPGDTLTFRTEVQNIHEDGAMAMGTCRIGDELLAEIELVFAHLDEEKFGGGELFEPAELMAMLRLLRLYDVGRKADGSRLDLPPHLLAAEKATLGL